NTVPGIRCESTLKSASRSRSGVGRTAMPGTLFSFRLRKRPPITLISADLYEAVSPLPALLDVMNDRPQLIAVAVLDYPLCLRPRHLQHIGITHQIPHPKPGYSGLLGPEELTRPAQPHIHIRD